MRLALARKPQEVYGHAIASPRLTYRAVWMLVTRVGLPIVALGTVLDWLVAAAR